jgi:hypothetical protein
LRQGRVVLCAALVAALIPSLARAERRQVLEAEALITFAEHLGRSPLVVVATGIELGAGRSIGLLVGGLAVIASPRSLTFLPDTAAGGGANLAVRFHIRGTWPRGFGIGVAASLAVVDGVSVLNPRVELYYRFILASHLAIRLLAAGGGMFVWDTQPADQRPGPGWDEDAAGDSITGASIGVGLAIGWSGTPGPRDEERGVAESRSF